MKGFSSVSKYVGVFTPSQPVRLHQGDGLSSKRIALKGDVLQDRKIHCFRCVRASFSPEILQAGSMKGLNTLFGMKL